MTIEEDKQDFMLCLATAIVLIIITTTALWVFGGAEIALQQYWTFAPLLIFPLLAGMALTLGLKNPVLGFVFHQPKYGLLGNLWVFKQPLTSLFVFTLIGIVFGIYSATTNTFFVGAPSFQVSETARLWLAAEPAAFTETLFFFGLIAMTVAKTLTSFVLGSRNWKIAFVIGVLFGGVAAFPAYHVFRYGDVQSNLFLVLVFGAISAFLFILSGSLIPLWVFHSTSNLFVEMKALFQNDLIILFGGLLLVAVFAVGWQFGVFRKKGD